METFEVGRRYLTHHKNISQHPVHVILILGVSQNGAITPDQQKGTAAVHVFQTSNHRAPYANRSGIPNITLPQQEQGRRVVTIIR